MRGMGRASHPQGAAPPLASLYPGLSSIGPSGRTGYMFVNHFRLGIMIVDGRRRGFRRPEGPLDDSPGQRPGFGWCEKNPASCKPPPDLLRAGRGVVCRMRGMGRASHPQGVAPPLASLYPGLSSGGPSGRTGYTYVNHFRSDMMIGARRQSPLPPSGRGIARRSGVFLAA